MLEKAMADHEASVAYVANQNARGGDNKLKVCCDWDSKKKYPKYPTCTCDAANFEAFVCAPEGLLAESSRPATAVIGSGARYEDRMPSEVTSAARWFPDVTPDARVMAELLGDGTLAVQPEPAHALSPQYVQREIGWKKLSEQGRRD